MLYLFFIYYFTLSQALSFINVINESNGTSLNLFHLKHPHNGICTVQLRGLSVLRGSAILAYIKSRGLESLAQPPPAAPLVVMEESGDCAERMKGNLRKERSVQKGLEDESR